MKRRDGKGGSERRTSANYEKSDWKTKRNERRLGGKGLSLDAFANAKSNPSGYNPSLIKKQKEFYRNAKYVGKYKKLLKQQNQTGDLLARASEHEVGNNEANVPKPSRNKKKISLQSSREEYEKKRAEEEKARMEREAIIQAKKEERAKAEAKRKSLREKMFKRTRSGQPVMKYRIQHILEGLMEGSQK